MTATAIEMVIDPRERPIGESVVRRVLPYRHRRMVGPFIFADIIGPEEYAQGTGSDIDAHPHIGLSTLSYLFSGGLLHRDSTGAVADIAPGDVNWMTAGAGVCHTERSPAALREGGHTLAGLQTWVALPVEHEGHVPFFEHADADEIPHERAPGVEIAMAAGAGWGQTSPVVGSSPLLEAEIRLRDASVTIPAEYPQRAVIAIQGQLSVAGRALTPGQAAVLARDEPVELHGTGRAMLLAGDPVGDRFIWWNFVASDRALIEQAKSDWDAQRFPVVPDDHEVWMPAPPL
ncbi:MAG: pirin family protein [Candidatus Nanopelagicales bacterium]